MSWILTASGHHFNYQHPSPDAICILDIATALSREARFNGHTSAFYSVAQHSVMASRLVTGSLRMEALLHDASEAYLKDLPSPLKLILPEYKAIESRVDMVIRRKFGLPRFMSPIIKDVDMVLLATERRDLMPVDACPWECLEGVSPLEETITPWTHAEAQQRFLNRYMDLLCGEDPRG